MRLARPIVLSALFGLLGLGVALLFGKPEDFLEIRNLSGRTLLVSALLLALSLQTSLLSSSSTLCAEPTPQDWTWSRLLPMPTPP